MVILSDTRICLNLSNRGWEQVMRPDLYEQISALGRVVRYNKDEAGASHQAMLAVAAENDIMVTSWGSEPLYASDLGKTGNLKLLIHGAGSVRSIVTADIIASGVRTVQCAGAIAKAVAHYTVGLIVLGLRNSTGRYLLMREGTRPKWPYRDLDETTVGLVGLSQVGRQVPPLLHPFGAKVLAYDPFWTHEQAKELGVELVGLEELVLRSDVVSLHAPVLDETKGMISRDLIAQMKPGTVFVNTARGVLVDQDALFERCYKGEITACLDVTTPEPLPADHPAWQCPFVFITPHIAGPTQESLRRIGQMIVDNIRRFQENQPLTGEVTAERYHILA